MRAPAELAGDRAWANQRNLASPVKADTWFDTPGPQPRRCNNAVVEIDTPAVATVSTLVSVSRDEDFRAFGQLPRKR